MTRLEKPPAHFPHPFQISRKRPAAVIGRWAFVLVEIQKNDFCICLHFHLIVCKTLQLAQGCRFPGAEFKFPDHHIPLGIQTQENVKYVISYCVK